MKNILWYILNKIRYFICLVIIIYIALPLVPLIVFTKWSWSWLWILIIANEKCCSLLEAKKIYLENKDEKYTFKPSKEISSYNLNTNEDLLKSNTSYCNNEEHKDHIIQTHSTQIYTDINYSWMEGNIYHR